MVKGIFAEVIKIRPSRWEDYPGLSGWAQCNHRGSLQEEAEGLGRGGEVKTDTEVGLMEL